MSTILEQIDDTLDDWRGSNDAMRWRPEPEPPTAEQLALVTATFHATIVPAFREVARQVNSMFEALKPLLVLLAEPRPSALNARYHRRYRNRQGRR